MSPEVTDREVTDREVTGRDACKAMGLHRFVRVKEDLARDVMLAEPEVARGIAGVGVSSEGEDFVIEPAEVVVGV